MDRRAAADAGQARGQGRSACSARFGLAKGKWKGRDRYLEIKGDDTTEVLIDPTWAVPVRDQRGARRGAAIPRDVHYEPGPGGSMLRKVAHVERALGDEAGKGGRMVLDVELANVRLEQER